MSKQSRAEKPDSMTLGEWLSTRVARLETRRYDWNVLSFQTDVDPKYRRAQIRYLGTGAAGASSDPNTVSAEHFTFSTMLLPPGSEGPLHLHTDVEEVFFVLKGRSIRMFFELDGDEWETYVGERDLLSAPPGVYRGVANEGEEEALICVMLGTGKPQLPTYPPDHPLSKVDRARSGS